MKTNFIQRLYKKIILVFFLKMSFDMSRFLFRPRFSNMKTNFIQWLYKKLCWFNRVNLINIFSRLLSQKKKKVHLLLFLLFFSEECVEVWIPRQHQVALNILFLIWKAPRMATLNGLECYWELCNSSGGLSPSNVFWTDCTS